MKPVIKVWCLPKMTEEALEKLYRSIGATVIRIKELGLNDESDIICLFPSDMMTYGIGEEIVVEVTGIFGGPRLTEIVQARVAKALGKTVLAIFPKARIEVFVYPLEPKQGWWDSRLII
ncbi:MAG: hypothetical protein Q8P17_05205 [bacterium]|nr:hypothetical protein [bacterium]